MIGYLDSDFAGCVDSRKSTFGYLFLLGEGTISWKSAKQSVIALSTMKAEFVACYEATIHALWLRNFISGLGVIDTITKPLKIIVIIMQQFSSPKMTNILEVLNIWN